MSTEFTLPGDHDDTQFVRYYNAEAGGAAYEFGTVSNFERVSAMFDMGLAFEANYTLDSDPTSRQDLEALAVAGRVTFGVFPVTVAVGSGNLVRFTVEEG